MYMVNLVLWLIFGGLAGWIASLIIGADAQLGLLGNIIVGIVGAVIGGFIADTVGAKEGGERPTTLISFAFAVLGAIILLAILNFIF